MKGAPNKNKQDKELESDSSNGSGKRNFSLDRVVRRSLFKWNLSRKLKNVGT